MRFKKNIFYSLPTKIYASRIKGIPLVAYFILKVVEAFLYTTLKEIIMYKTVNKIITIQNMGMSNLIFVTI